MIDDTYRTIKKLIGRKGSARPAPGDLREPDRDAARPLEELRTTVRKRRPPEGRPGARRRMTSA
jgi:hypothetical protein